MHLINVETLRLETFVGDNIPPYAILSHTWGADEEEVCFEDIWSGNIEKPGNGTGKLKGCCNQAKEDHLEYAWIDTCCIDKKSSKELDEAINSMFQWYKKASICYTYLSDVPHGDDSWDPGSKFFSSRWFQRGWTLQELLAPEELRFYNREWVSIGRRSDMSNEVERITGISREFLLGWKDIRKASVAQRMSWAAKRKTSRKEDSAYCLLGIFDVTMPMIYGEGDRAFSRLQQEIMNITSDHSILTWGLDTTEYTPSKSAGAISAGILATAPSDFANCGRIVLRKQDATPANTFDISSGRLRMHLSIHTTSAGETFGLLNCGLEHNAEQVVGIPLHKAVSGAAPDEYFRPQGLSSVLLPRTATRISTKHIYIQMGRENRAHEAMGRRLWLHIDGHQKMNLEEEIYPPVRWEKARALIAEASDSDGHITRRYLARFRTQGETSRDVIVVLEFKMHGLQPQARCHVMTSSRDTALEDLFQNFIYIRPEALGKQAASNGKLNVKVTVKEEQVAQEPMLVVRLAPASSSLEVPVDANLELYQVNLKLEFVRILQKEDQVCLETEQLAQQRDEEMATLDQMRERLAVIEEDLRKLGEEKRALSDRVEQGTQQVDELTNRLNAARQQQDKWSGRESEIQQRLDELETKQGSGNWLETTIKTQLGAGQIGRGLKDAGDLGPRAVESGHNIDSQTPLLWAAMNGHEAVARLLLEKGADLEVKDRNGYTLLMLAALKGHEAVARLLLERGADLEAKIGNGNTPLMLATYNGHEAVARLLLEKGARKRLWDRLFL
ncbi:hypothetical protein NW754_013645 [Fusarium falciforme]|nr:hypothetical protein NW754_013645 [Fusarium falciforme]